MCDGLLVTHIAEAYDYFITQLAIVSYHIIYI